jgi:CsoR family transcriptional regulator, copper-sensing transcriptional repressor
MEHDCATTDQMAHGVDEELRQSALKRLRRIEGQVRGLHKMVEEGRYCADILTQVASVQEALGGVGKLLLKNHLKHCVTHAVVSGDALDADKKFEELVELFGRHWK